MPGITRILSKLAVNRSYACLELTLKFSGSMPIFAGNFSDEQIAVLLIIYTIPLYQHIKDP